MSVRSTALPSGTETAVSDFLVVMLVLTCLLLQVMHAF